MSRRASKIFRWGLLLLLAIVVTVACRAFLVELYTVAPQQMEKTLLSGDRVVVNKWSYGLRMPHYCVNIPLGGQRRFTIPARPLPYKRVALTPVRRHDIVVFNYPDWESGAMPDAPAVMARCVGVPGDKIVCDNGQLYINDVATAQSPHLVEAYLVADTLAHKVDDVLGLHPEIACERHALATAVMYYLERCAHDKLVSLLPDGVSLERVALGRDNYTVHLPPYGSDAVITPLNAAQYATIINRYEPIRVELRGDVLYHNGKPLERYRFTQPYYWFLCDNRTSEGDSRTFGVVPHSHVVGECLSILFSINPNATGSASWRFGRFFHSVSNL